jgi:hypothetical protein
MSGATRVYGALAVSVSLLCVAAAHADSTSSTPVFPGPAPTATSSAPPAPKPTSTGTASSTDLPSRGPSSLDQQNTYHQTNGVLPQAGSPYNKEPVIDGKSIPQVIDFSGHKSNVGGVAAPSKKPPAKPKRPSKKRADKPEEDDGLNAED